MKAQPRPARRWPSLRRGHAASFAGLLLFTAVVYFRPYELVPALSGFTSMAFWLAVATLLVFVPTQLSVEGTLTARPREVNLALLLLLAGLLSVPLALEPAEAWWAFLDFAKVITMFVVMVNVVRTEWRWRLMVWLALVVSVVLSANAVADYAAGNLAMNGMRIEGVIGGLFDNPNDLALHLVTMIPLSLGLLLVARGPLPKIIYGLCALLDGWPRRSSPSRAAASWGSACALFVLAWKLGRGKRLRVVLLFAAAGALFFAFVPSDYTGRLLTSFGGDADGGSSSARQNLLWRSLQVTVANPLLGIGMNNFHIVSIREQVSHNAYTQISAEMGVAALVIYVMFLVLAQADARGRARDARRAPARARLLPRRRAASQPGRVHGQQFLRFGRAPVVHLLPGGLRRCACTAFTRRPAPLGAFGRPPAGRRPAAAAGSASQRRRHLARELQ